MSFKITNTALESVKAVLNSSSSSTTSVLTGSLTLKNSVVAGFFPVLLPSGEQMRVSGGSSISAIHVTTNGGPTTGTTGLAVCCSETPSLIPVLSVNQVTIVRPITVTGGAVDVVQACTFVPTKEQPYIYVNVANNVVYTNTVPITVTLVIEH